MPGTREALVVANEAYGHPDLARLAAPSADAEELAAMLGRPDVGAFHVRVCTDLSAQDMRVEFERFLVERRPDDLAVLYFSGHGIKSLSGALHLAAVDTDPQLLSATAVGCDFVQGLLGQSRARRIALFLDCCYGGAFVHGMSVKAGRDVHVRDSFADLEDVGQGRGRVIITASGATQFAFEDGELRPGSRPKPSVFTRAVVDGLASPETDRDHDGWIGLHELFLHVEDDVRRRKAEQTPQLWALGAQGDIRLARSSGPTPVTGDEDRLRDVATLRSRLRDPDLPRALAAHGELEGLTDHASPVVADAAARALGDARLVVVPDDVDLGRVPVGRTTSPRPVSLSGLPLALMVAAHPSDPWIYADREGDLVRIRAAPPTPGPHRGYVRLAGPVREHRVTVTVEGLPAQPPRLQEGSPVAGMGQRLLARLIDLMVFGLGFTVVAMVAPAESTEGGGTSNELSAAASTALIALFALYGLYETALVARRGQTLGKRLAQIRVVTVDGGRNPGWGRAGIRYLTQLFAWFTCLGVLVLYLSPYWDPGRRNRGWHDLAAGTLVVKATAPTSPPSVAS